MPSRYEVPNEGKFKIRNVGEINFLLALMVTLPNNRKTTIKGALTAVDQVSFWVKKGELFGLYREPVMEQEKTSIFRIAHHAPDSDAGYRFATVNV